MLLDNYLSLVSDIKKPTLANNGYGIDLYAPESLYLLPNAHLAIKSGIILKLPEPILGIVAPKAHLDAKFQVTSGVIIYPNYDKEIIITLKYLGLSETYIHKDEPLLQIAFNIGIKLDA